MPPTADKKRTEHAVSGSAMAREYAFQRVISEVLALSLTVDSLEVQMGKALDLVLSIPEMAILGRGAVYLYDAEADSYTMVACRGFDPGEVLPCQAVHPGDCYCGAAVAEGRVLFIENADCSQNRAGGPPFPHGHYCIPIRQDGQALGLINIYITPGHHRVAAEEKCLTMVADTLAGIIRHHQIEKGRRQLEEQLVRSEKMAALGRLAGRFAHEIRNPLTAVGGLARRLDKNHLASTKGREYARHIVEEVERLEGVLNNLLTMSQDEPPATEPHDINLIITYLLKMLEGRCASQQIVVRSRLQEVPFVHMDRHLVREALENVLQNALDAMAHGGELVVVSEASRLAEQPAVRLTIRDSGPGIPAGLVEQIFEPFYTSKGSAGRPGLGLATTKKIVADHNGVIKVESAEGVGTTFVIVLPAGPPSLSGKTLPPLVVNELVDELTVCDRDLTILQSAVEHTNEAFVTIDADSRIVLFNKAAETLFGYQRAEVIGVELGTIIGEEVGRRHHSAVAAYVRQGSGKLIGHETEMRLTRRDGSTVPVAISFSVAQVGGRPYFTGVVRDLTTTKALQEKALNAERLAALGQMVAELSHEIKNPLVTIGGLARQLGRKEQDTGKRQKLDVIAREIARLEELLVELRDLYRPRPLAMESVVVRELLEEVVAVLAPMAAAKEVRLEVEAPAEQLVVMADRLRLQQVLLNLQKNAVEATPAGGRVVLRLTSAQGRVSIQVIDGGSGLSAELRQRMFAPFFTTKRQGTGLGLSISKRIIEEHPQGELTARNGEEGGAVFEILLPCPEMAGRG